MNTVKRSLFDPVHPWWLVPISLAAGAPIAGALAGGMLMRTGRKAAGMALGGASVVLGVAFFLFLIVWEAEWRWIAFTLFSTHLVCGLGLCLALRPTYRRWSAENPPPPADPGSGQKALRSVFVGLAGGFFLGGALGPVCISVFNLALDSAFSSLYLVTFDNSYTIFRVALGSLGFAFSGAAAGALLGRFRPNISPRELLFCILAFVWARLTLEFALEGGIAMPGFQAGGVTGDEARAMYFPLIGGEILVNLWWAPLLMFFITAPSGLKGKLSRAAQAVGMNGAVAVALAIGFGFTPQFFLFMGLEAERKTEPLSALSWYERGLKKTPNETTAAFLQYRTALLYHKIGDEQKAEQGFRRVVAKYTASTELVRKADSFLSNLNRSQGDAEPPARVVLPGVEMRQEYKDAYCVPNSLALVMRFWGADVTAAEIGRSITGLGTGTYIPDEAWFAEERGYAHTFLPMATLEDIKACIDAGFPVLVYVPQHVFAIFGYDDALQTFVTFDVATRDVWSEYLQVDFIAAWKKEEAVITLVYPPEQEKNLPEELQRRLARLSDGYLHYSLYPFPTDYAENTRAHLLKAAGDSGEFFFPVTRLYATSPGLRSELDKRFPPQRIIDGILRYFGDGFDEAAAFAGQKKKRDYAPADRALGRALRYMLAHQRIDETAQLIETIDNQGQLNFNRYGLLAMLELARGDVEKGIERINSEEYYPAYFYVGLSNLSDKRGHIVLQDLIEPLENQVDELWEQVDIDSFDYSEYGPLASMFAGLMGGVRDDEAHLHFDYFSYPSAAMANRIIVEWPDFGQSRDELEELWWDWLAFIPFDGDAAAGLERIYRKRLENMNPRKAPAKYEDIERRADIAGRRAERYALTTYFDQAD